MMKHRLLRGHWAYSRVALIGSIVVGCLGLVLSAPGVRAEDDDIVSASVLADRDEARPAAKPKSDSAAKAEKDGDAALLKASSVSAVYRISWLGNHIGDLKLHSSVNNRQYTLNATADVSLLFGAFAWQGTTTSRGLMSANGPIPQNYTFKYSAGEKREAVELKFNQRMVQDIVINPPPRTGGHRVPITAAHLQNVVDPLSSSILLSQARLTSQKENACNRRLPIFDGKVRYDLVLTPKGTRSIGNNGKFKGTAQVCSVRYVPIAGHKPGKPGEEDYATGNTGIEVWLVAMPEAGLMVPYYISVPTPAGTATLTTAKFDVETPVGRHAVVK